MLWCAVHAQMGPLAAAYLAATKAAGASFNQAIAEALCDSDPGMELKITGVVLNGERLSVVTKHVSFVIYLHLHLASKIYEY